MKCVKPINWKGVGAGCVLMALLPGLTSCGCGEGGAAVDPQPTLPKSDRLLDLDNAERTAKAMRAAESFEVVEPTPETRSTKAAAAEPTVCRLFNGPSSAHFYVASLNDCDPSVSQANSFAYAGPDHPSSRLAGGSLTSMYGFFNASNGVHFYTISEIEKNPIQQMLLQFQIEGVAYCTSKVAVEGCRPLSRSFSVKKRSHLYSVDASESALLEQSRTEGVAKYMVGTATAVAPLTDPGPSIDVVCGLPNFQTDLMQQINAARAKSRSCGGSTQPATTALVWNANLQSASAQHSADMAKNNFFSHTGSDASSVVSRTTTAGYNGRGVGENIAAGQGNVTSVMAGWLKSPAHCNNIMNGDFSDVALACVSQPGTRYGKYWTLVLGKRW